MTRSIQQIDSAVAELEKGAKDYQDWRKEASSLKTEFTAFAIAAGVASADIKLFKADWALFDFTDKLKRFTLNARGDIDLQREAAKRRLEAATNSRNQINTIRQDAQRHNIDVNDRSRLQDELRKLEQQAVKAEAAAEKHMARVVKLRMEAERTTNAVSTLEERMMRAAGGMGSLA
ncbi:hypothetical protein [Actinomadura rayongensis]|uniref:Uncharacterized protein n=1 Tax=Actinomadura rayongensis TaxID=1429076 RepID=A0A6I4W046_9ACTN|nr:hypothetical protein [Actinomadura rayongensis]MXQ63959.1 hypothetical protein [Actinomadura rayongensis]